MRHRRRQFQRDLPTHGLKFGEGDVAYRLRLKVLETARGKTCVDNIYFNLPK